MTLAALVLGASLVWGVAPEGQPAGGRPLELEWEAPDGCPDRETVERAIETQLGLSLASLPGQVRAKGRIRAVAAGGYELELSIAGTAEVRRLAAPQCGTLGAAAAFSLALILDPSLERPDPRPAGPPMDASPPESASGDPKTRRIRGLVRVDGGFEYGILPGLGGAAGMALGLEWGPLRFELDGHYGTPRSTELVDTQAGARFQSGTVAVRACGVPRVSRLGFPLCAGVEGGAMRADGFGLIPNRTTHRPLLHVQLSAGIDVALGRGWSLVLGAVGLVPVLRPAVEVTGGGELHRVGPAGVRAVLGVQAAFGPGARGREKTPAKTAPRGR